MRLYRIGPSFSWYTASEVTERALIRLILCSEPEAINSKGVMKSMRLTRLAISIATLVLVVSCAALAQLPVPPPTDRPFPVEGIITGIDPNAGSVTLNGPRSTTDTGIAPTIGITFLVTSQTRIFKDGVPAGFDALKIGDLCHAAVVKTERGLVALEVAAKAPPPPTIVLEGIITALDPETHRVTLNGQTPQIGSVVIAPRPAVSFAVTPLTVITRNGAPAGFSDLKLGDRCRAVVFKTEMGLVAREVAAKGVEPPLVWANGKIAKIDYENARFVLSVGVGENTRYMQFTYDRGTTITKDGCPAGPGEVKVGDLARVGYLLLPTMRPDATLRAAAIEARTPPEGIAWIRGRIVRIGAEEMLVGVAPNNADCADSADCVRFFQVTRFTRIVKMGEAGFNALCVGDMVELGYPKESNCKTPPAISIFVCPERFGGKIAKLDVEARAMVVQDGEKFMEFFVAKEARILKNGRLVPLYTLKAGDLVKVRYYMFREANVAFEVIALSPRTVEPKPEH